MSAWRSFETDPPPQFRKVIVTNNLKARDAHGQMSHVWVGLPQVSSGPTDSFPRIPEKGSWMMFTDSYDTVQYLTHWCEIPYPEGERA